MSGEEAKRKARSADKDKVEKIRSKAREDSEVGMGMRVGQQ